MSQLINQNVSTNDPQDAKPRPSFISLFLFLPNVSYAQLITCRKPVTKKKEKDA